MRNLANLFYGEGLRSTLDRIATETRPSPTPAEGNSGPSLQASQTPGSKDLAVVPKPALADDEIAINLSIAQSIICSKIGRYLDACRLRAWRPVELEFTNKFLQADISNLGLVALPAVDVQPLLRDLHEPDAPLSRALPQLRTLSDTVDRFELYHPFGFTMPFRSVPMVMCRPAKWAEQLALMNLALKNHVGLLITIRFQLALRDRSETALNNLLDALKSMEHHAVELAPLQKSLAAVSSSGNLMDGVEKAYAQFRIWFESVLKAGEDSRRYLPPELGQARGPNPPALPLEAPLAEPSALATEQAQVKQTSSPEPASVAELEEESATVLQPSNPPVPRSRAALRSKSAQVAPDATIGNSVTIRAGAIVESRVFIGDDVTIGAQACIGTRSIVEKGARIGASVKLPAYLTVASNAQITSLDLRGNVKLGQGTVLCGNVICYSNVDLKEACRLGAGVEIASGITVSDAVHFSTGAKVNAWNAPKGTRGLTAGGSLYVKRNARLGPNVTVGANVLIDEDAVIEAGARIGSHVKIGYGKTVGAGARIADELEIIADVPAGTVVGMDGTAPDGRRYAHMISTFTISKGGVVKVTPTSATTTTGSIPPALPVSTAPAPEVASPVVAQTAAMETETLVLQGRANMAASSGAPVPQPSDGRDQSPAKASKRLAAVAEPSAKDRPSVELRSPGRRINDRRAEVGRERPVVNVRNLPSVGLKKTAETNTLKRPAGVPELGEQPSQKRLKPNALSGVPAAAQTSGASPIKAKTKTAAQAPAPQGPQPSRVDLLMESVSWTGANPAESRRATVHVPTQPPAPSANVPTPTALRQTVSRAPQVTPKTGL